MYCRQLNKMLKETETYFNEFEKMERNPKFSKIDKQKLERIKSRCDTISEIIGFINK